MRSRRGIAQLIGCAAAGGSGSYDGYCMSRRNFLSWLSGQRRRRRSGALLRQFREHAAEGIGGSSDGVTRGSYDGDGTPGDRRGGLRAWQSFGMRRGDAGGGRAAAAATTTSRDALDELLTHRPAHLYGTDRLPLTYDIQVLQAEREREEREQAAADAYARLYDENNMPRQRNGDTTADAAPATAAPPQRAEWEYEPTPEHKALVLMLYRNLLKSLVQLKSVRRRSLIAYARFAVRRRAAATEKLLIDECIEECRRALFVLQKNHDMLKTGSYEFDSMYMPKDTGQDVKTYMEEVYDPEVSRQQFQHFSDVEAGKEHLHQQNLGPTSGPHHWRGTTQSTSNSSDNSGGKSGGAGASPQSVVREEDMVFRPPPPPDMLCDDDDAHRKSSDKST